ncbi:hypothetical protein P4282_17845 [Bacillus swezeyi]|uniref:hypothetical protein n=1 Tax=Bacillus swezeyi TaxID=1925020 RepID=UPI002E207ADF|nr:hypothetical protein [Bacillus swezeyi]
MKDEHRKIMSAVSYYKTERTIDGNQQHYTKKQYDIYLYEDKILTGNRHFSLEHVNDVSYRPISDAGLLYLHTNQGVFAFEVNVDPAHFIKSYKKLKNSIK